jgi:serine/threonine protein kinase
MKAEDFKKRYLFDPQKDFLGEGSYSRVYRAQDTLLQREICIKLFRKELTAGSLLIQELNRAGVFFHPHLCAFYDLIEIEDTNVLGEQETQPIGIVEYIQGGDAVQYARSHGADSPEVKKIIKDYLKGLSYLHSLGKPHLNLKPTNLLVKLQASEHTGKITDFFNQENLHTDSSHTAVDPNSLCYKAPECFETENKEASYPADIWALGVIVYEMVTGDKLFLHEHDSPEKVIRNICYQDYADQINRLPQPYRGFVRQCLVREPSLRTVSLEELTLLIDGTKVITDEPIAAALASPTVLAATPMAAAAPTATIKTEQTNRGGLSLPLIALALLILGATSAFIWRIVGKSKPPISHTTTAITPSATSTPVDGQTKIAPTTTIIHDTVRVVQVIENRMPVQYAQPMPQRTAPTMSAPSTPAAQRDAPVPILPVMEYMYTGKSYYVDLKTPLLSEEEFSLVSDRATVTTLGKNTFYIKPYNEPGSINVMVLNKKNNAVLAQKVYNVRSRPLPVPTLGDDITGGIVSPKLLLAKLTLQAKSDNGSYHIKSFRMTCKTGSCDIDDVSNDGRFNESMIRFLHNVKSGERLYFDNILAEDENGLAVKLNDFQVTTY